MSKRKWTDAQDVQDLDHSKKTKTTTNLQNLNKASSDKLIKDLNSLHADEFQGLYIDKETLRYSSEIEGTPQSCQIDFKSSAQLTKDEQFGCFNLIESTSRHDYEASSWGWHPQSKNREMQENEMRYLLVRNSKPGRNDTQGFLSFMLTHDSTPSIPVLYIYEIHLDKSIRKIGLGAHLMDLVESVARRVGVEKVMLTCFLSNERAHAFYERRGYETDVCSPEDRKTRRKVVKVDYVIMSKGVRKSPADSGIDIGEVT